MSYFKERFISLFMVISLIVLIGAGCHPFGQKPEEVITKMNQVMSGIQSLSYQLSANIVNKKVNQEKPDSQLELSLNGYGSLISSSDINLQTGLEGKLLIDGNSTKPTTIPFSVEIRSRGRGMKQILYLKINKATDYPFFNLSDLKDKWYKFDQNKNNLLNLNADLPVNQLTEEQIKNLRQLLAKSSFFKVSKVLKEESVQNINCYHYEVSLNPDDLKIFIDEAAKIIKQSFIGQNDFNKFLTESAGLKGEIWIGQKDYYLYQIKIADIRLTDNKEVNVETNISIQLSEFNKTREVLEPEDSVELNLNDILAGFNISGGTKKSVTNDNDNDGLSDYLESIYQTNPDHSDTDSDGFLDGEEVNNGYNPKGEGKLKEVFTNLSN